MRARARAAIRMCTCTASDRCLCSEIALRVTRATVRGQAAKIHPTKNDGGNQPAQQEQRDDEKAEECQVIVERIDGFPKLARQLELGRDQTERFDAADQCGDGDRNSGDRQIVLELAQRVDEGPAIGADHENAVRGIDESHAGGKQRREYQNQQRR